MIGPPTQLLGRTRRPGIYRVVSPSVRVAASLRGAGWSAVVLAPTAGGADFCRELAAAFGVDLAGIDQLDDVLAARILPTALVLPQWTRLARSAPAEWSRILEVLRQRTEAEPPFAVVLA
jgi:hypothetical protein